MVTKATKQPAVERLYREGFYRIELHGAAGIGCCIHRTTTRSEVYEDWTILFMSPVFGGRSHPATITTSSRSEGYRHLLVGKAIGGLPRNLSTYRPVNLRERSNTDPSPNNTVAGAPGEAGRG